MLVVSACGGTGTPALSEPTTTPAVGPSPRPVLQYSDQNLRFERISIEQGLSHSTVNCILQDSKGFMWFGTSDGLNKYNGYSFTVYRHDPNDPHSLSHNRVTSIFEEVAFRGIVLTVFLSKYSERKSIIFSSIGFGIMHLLNLVFGRDLVWVMAQVIWAFTIGLFYGYVFVRTHSLLPPMIVHYLGNVFIGSLTGYMQNRASIEVQALYGVIFSFGVVPATLMILWARFFTSRWLPAGDDPG